MKKPLTWKTPHCACLQAWAVRWLTFRCSPVKASNAISALNPSLMLNWNATAKTWTTKCAFSITMHLTVSSAWLWVKPPMVVLCAWLKALWSAKSTWARLKTNTNGSISVWPMSHWQNNWNWPNKVWLRSTKKPTPCTRSRRKNWLKATNCNLACKKWWKCLSPSSAVCKRVTKWRVDMVTKVWFLVSCQLKTCLTWQMAVP